MFRKLSLALVICITALSSVWAQNPATEPGLTLMDYQKYEAARKFFKDLSVADASNPEYQFYLGEISYQLDEPEQARAYFEKAAGLNASNPFSLIAQARIKAEDKNYAEAKTLANKAVSMAPKNPEVLVQASRVFISYEPKDAQSAIDMLLPVVDNFKKTNIVLLALGDAYMNLNPYNLNEAIKYYERAIDPKKPSALANVRVGQIYARVRNYEEAMKYFDEAFKIDSNYAPVRKERAEIFYVYKRFEKAKNEYESYLKIVENDINARTRYASFLYLTKEYDKSLAEIKDIQKIDTSSNILFRIAGYDSYELGKYDEAKTYIESYMRRVKPDRILASDYEYYARTISKLGDDSTAIVYYLKAAELDTTRTDLKREAARALTKAKRYNESIEIQRSLLNSQADAPTYLDLGIAYLSSLQFDSASAAFSKVIELKPDNYYGYIFKAKAESNLDPDLKTASAKQYYEKFLEMMATSPDAPKQKRNIIEANSYLGSYYFMKKDNANACIYWKKVKELEPQNNQATQFLKQVKCP